MDKLEYQNLTYSEADAILQENFSGIKRSFVAVGYYLKRIRDDELFWDGGYKSVWDYAEDRFGIKRTTASRWMSINDKFSENGNSPNLAERYADFGKGQLQEMLYLEEEQLDKITPDMTVKEIREVRKPEPEHEEEPVSVLGYPLRVYPEDSLTATPGCGKQDCFSCHRDGCEIRQVDCYCVEAPMGNPFPCTTLNVVDSLRQDIGNRCQFVNSDLADVRSGDGQPVPCCKRCNNPCGYECNRSVQARNKAKKAQQEEMCDAAQTGICIHRPEFACTLSESSKLAVGDGIDCNVKCCWDCLKRIDCGYRCNSAAGHPVEEQVVEECATSYTEAMAEEHEEDIGESNVEEPDVIVDADFKELPEEQEEKVEKTSVRSDKELLKEMLEKEQTYLKDFLKYYTEKDIRVRQQKIKVAALAGMLCDLDIDDKETVQEEQPELPVLKNNDQRKEFIDNYSSWPLWIETKETGERYYKYDFCNGTSAVVKVYFHKCFDFMSTAGTRYEERYKDGYGAEEYYLLMNGKHFKDCRTNMSALIEHLKNLKKGEKNGEKR